MLGVGEENEDLQDAPDSAGRCISELKEGRPYR